MADEHYAWIQGAVYHQEDHWSQVRSTIVDMVNAQIQYLSMLNPDPAMELVHEALVAKELNAFPLVFRLCG